MLKQIVTPDNSFKMCFCEENGKMGQYLEVGEGEVGFSKYVVATKANNITCLLMEERLNY